MCSCTNLFDRQIITKCHVLETMSTRVQSRIGGARINFKSYDVQDTMTILKTRLGMFDNNHGYTVFEEDAIKASSAVKPIMRECLILSAFYLCSCLLLKNMTVCSS